MSRSNSDQTKDQSSRSTTNVLGKSAEFCYSPVSAQTVSSCLDLNREFNLYSSTFSQSEDFSKYWQMYSKKLPILTAFIKRYCIISASSVASESAFSIANFLQRKERSNLC